MKLIFPLFFKIHLNFNRLFFALKKISQLQQHIRQRLCPLVKYTCSNGQYWDNRLNRFVSIHAYFYCLWYSSYLVGHIFQAFLAFYLIHLYYSIDVPEINYGKSSSTENEDQMVISTGIVIWFIFTTVLSTASVTTEYQNEITETFNQAFALDASFKQRFPNSTPCCSNKLETLISLICFAPLILPFIFGIAFF